MIAFKQRAFLCTATLLYASGGWALADPFGTGQNAFTIDFLPISGATNPASGYGIVHNDYRIAKFEITNDQWHKFQAAYGTVTGTPSNAYEWGSTWTGTNVPVNEVSWYEAAQFVNWLNTSTGHQPAYRFTGSQGTSDYAFAAWSAAEADNGTNVYRNKDAMYYLPTDAEWVKAAYWDGTTLQTYATKPGENLSQGNGTSGTGWNYYDGTSYATDPYGPWNVGSGSEELNGTFDMMGNVWEWTESPSASAGYQVDAVRLKRGGAFFGVGHQYTLKYTGLYGEHPNIELNFMGFRVASEIPEPATAVFLLLGGLALVRRPSQRGEARECGAWSIGRRDQTSL